MKAIMFAAVVLATPTYAENCEAYRDQTKSGFDLVQSTASAAMAMSALSVTAEMSAAAKAEIRAINRRISEAIKDYNAATERTMKGVAAPCYR